MTQSKGMDRPALLKRFGGRGAIELSPVPAIWRAFQAQGAWKSWIIAVLLGLVILEAIAVARLASRPPEFVLVDADGKSTYVRRAIATEPLLQFLAERTKPPELAIVRFTRDFLHLALAVHSATIEANWPAALDLMSPELRGQMERESAAAKLVETYRLSQQKTDLSFDDISLVTRTPSLLHVRATVTRTRRSLLDAAATPVIDRVAVDLAEHIVPPHLARPDGLEVVEWHVEKLPEKAVAQTASSGSEDSPGR
jgi:hypothetical protein